MLTEWVALCLVPRLGGKTLSNLLNIFDSLENILTATEHDLLKVPLVNQQIATAIRQIDLKQVEQQIRQWQSEEIHLLTWHDPNYPEPLKNLADRPPLLFAKGNPAQNWTRAVAIVGTREPDSQSANLAQTMAHELSKRGWLIVSGLARGIDTAAHQSATQTAGFLGCGVNNIHPASNRDLAQRINAIYAEVTPETVPSAQTLMARNRLISGTARATIVIQAGINSGSMEAAKRARQQQKTVFTIDHPEYEGNQALIRLDAIPLAPDFQNWDGLAQQLENLSAPSQQLNLFG